MSTALVYQQLADYKKVTINKLESLLGVSNGSIRKAIGRNSSIKSDMVEKIVSTFPEVSRLWLMSGQGPMIEGQELETETPDPKKESGEDWRAKYYATLEEKARLIDETAKRSIQLADTAIARLNDVERLASDNSVMIDALRVFAIEHFAALERVSPETVLSDLNSVVKRVGREHKKGMMANVGREYS